jgi:hypothetical protein
LKVIVSITKPLNLADFGMYQLELINGGEQWITGISIHLLGGGYVPAIYVTSDYNATTTKGPIQLAIDEWEDEGLSNETGAIIFIPPGPLKNPEGAHLENIIMGSPPSKLQGVGPGGAIAKDPATRGTYLNGGNFGAGVLCLPPELFCDAVAAGEWRTNALRKSNDQSNTNNANLGLVEGPVLYVLGSEDFYNTNDWTYEARTGGIDGCLISGGTQLNPQPFEGNQPDTFEVVAVQGGGITVSCIFNKNL